MSGDEPLSARRYVVRSLRARPARSSLVVAGVAVAVAFFVLFSSMSTGLRGFIDDELDRTRPLHIYLEPDPTDPYTEDDIAYIGLLVEQQLGGRSTQRWTTPRVELAVSASPEGGPIRLWGVVRDAGEGSATPPYDLTARLAWGRHLDEADDGAASGRLACVLGARAREVLLPDAIEGSQVTIAPRKNVDPWWMPDATEYPLGGKDLVEAPPRGPVEARVVGALAPGQGADLDRGVFVAIHPLLRVLGQYDAGDDEYFYPTAVVTVEDGSGVDVTALEAAIAQQLPGTGGTDDAWDRAAFKASYQATSKAMDGWLAIVSVVLVVMLVAGISDTTVVAVADRRREMATLRAVGHSRRQVSRLVISEVLVLASVGLAVGLVAGTALALGFGHLHDATGGEGVFLAPVSVGAWSVMGAAVLALGTAALAAAYPARRAASGSPTEALRYE